MEYISTIAEETAVGLNFHIPARERVGVLFNRAQAQKLWDFSSDI